MHNDLLLSDRPVSLPQGQPMPVAAVDGLRFRRAMRAPLPEVMEQWADPLKRCAWLKPMKGSHFRVQHVAPAYLEAMETDGVYAVRIGITCEDEGELTMMKVQVAVMGLATTAILIACGYADHWEERLNVLTDQLIP